MRPWRECEDVWEEADRLEVAGICKNMGWTKRKLTNELDSVASPEAFLNRVRRALSDLDKPRLLAASAHTTNAAEDSDAAKGYTDIPHLALSGEPEAVPATYQDEIAKVGQERHTDAQQERNRERKGYPLETRLVMVKREAVIRGVDISFSLQRIEREIASAERLVDRVAA